MTRNEEIAWCAGFFDGEGYVGYNRTRPNVNTGRVSAMLWACVSQNTENMEVLEFFKSVIGFGKIYGPYATAKGKTRHELKYLTDEVRPLFQILKPYLRSEKTRDFEKAITSYEYHNPEMTLEDIERMTKNNKKKKERASTS